jgi:hypothetical protein
VGWKRPGSSNSPERRRRRRGGVILIGLLACSTVVWQASHATFSAATPNGTSTLGAGTVTITGSAPATAMFTATNLAPGATASICYGVSYTGSLTPSAIKVYFTGQQEQNANGGYAAWQNNSTFSEMDDDTTMEIQVSNVDLASDPGSGSPFACAGGGYGGYTEVAAVAPGTALNTLLATNTSFGSGLASNWGTVVQNEWRVFKFTYTFSSSAGNSAQGDGVKFNIVWEAQS